MLRTWQDVVSKWQVVQNGAGDEPDEAHECFDRARFALLDGRLDESLANFQRAATLRRHPHDQVGMGDVHLARGRWRTAAEHYERALTIDRGDSLAQLGKATLLVAQGKATAAVAELEPMVAGRPDDPVLRYYLASAWCSVAEQCRSQTVDEVLVITSEHQLRICERAARRI